MSKIKVLFVSNFSKAVTGFGKNMKNVLRALHVDDGFEVVEAANGCFYGADLRTPWKSYGTYPSNPTTRQKLESDPHQKRLAEYGNATIDEIIKIEKPDIIVGIEDVWAFDWASHSWFDHIPVVIWTTLDSSPVLQQAYDLSGKVDKFLVWASFAEKEMRANGVANVETIHGAIDLSSFYPLDETERVELRKKHGIDDFLIGFVFKNQLRKSVPNLLEGFKMFQKDCPNAKLLLHTDWVVSDQTWDIPRYMREKKINPMSVIATYLCKGCKNYFLKPYVGEDTTCPHCQTPTLVTKNNLFGVSENELNEIYNMMDVYCHPFTSGGQELPVQEAKAAGLITLVTEYSCGTDCCYEEQGGLPLEWVEYREPYTQFIKATTLPESICEQLNVVKNMNPKKKLEFQAKALECVEKNFTVEHTVGQLKEILEGYGKCDWDYNTEEKFYEEEYSPEDGIEDDLEWLLDLYKGMFDKVFAKEDTEIQEGLHLLKRESREKIVGYLKAVAQQKNSEKTAANTSLEDLLDGKKEDRIAIIIPESAGDVLICNSLIGNLKKLYPKKDIYFITDPKFFPMVNANHDIHKLIPFKKGIENLLLLEGQAQHVGYFEMAFLPHIGSQHHLNYLHNGKQQHQFSLQ